MNKKLIYHSLSFRLAAPVLFGVFIYLLILMFFDSLDMLSENFFSREVLFVIGLTFIYFEYNRFVIILCLKLLEKVESFAYKLFIQFLLAILPGIFIISFILYLYFIHIVGFSTIQTELITFNLIFGLTGIFYQLYYWGFTFLYTRNERIILSEGLKKQELEMEMKKFHYQANPEFLFHGLEIIISELHKDKKTADDLINALSKYYRYTLDNAKNEICPVKEETEILMLLFELFKAKYQNAIHCELRNIKKNKIHLVPGVLLRIFQQAVFDSIISESLPFEFKVELTLTSLLVDHTVNEKIKIDDREKSLEEELNIAYRLYTDQAVRITHQNKHRRIELPLLFVEDE
ncbi:MAG: histidine kinase [Bacteroidales bacterium]|nr:histidine kinase [Bacteroidales bacterium]